jgi:lipopolysaccharide export system protein LptA
VQADEATLFLGPENEVERVLASGNVNGETMGQAADPTHARADEAELLLTGKQNLLRTATLTGNVHVERFGSQPMQGDAGRAVLDFLHQNQLQKIHAADGVRLTQHKASEAPLLSQDARNRAPVDQATPASTPQDFDLTAPIVDFFVAEGHRLDRAQTSGAAQITISPAQNSTAGNAAASSQPFQRTIITAGRFDAKFTATADGKSRLASIHGAPEAKIVNVAQGMPDRVSTSNTLDATFFPEGGIEAIVQQGSVIYSDGLPLAKRTQAWADKARYTPADRILLLTGSPRVSDGGMVTTANALRINRANDDAFADGDVKSTYSDLKEQPNGALLASASPIHVTSATMTAHNSPAVALYQGHARLWQDANIIEAPSIQFDRNRRFVLAEGTKAQPVSTVLIQQRAVQQTAPTSTSMAEKHETKSKSEEKASQNDPVAIRAERLTYSDPERRAHYEGGVIARGNTFTATADEMDVYLQARNQTHGNQPLAAPGKLDRMVAQGHVVIEQPSRRAQGQTLIYTAADDKFVLTGGPPSIFDAERGKITGVSLTFYRLDDRVLVEGEARTPVVTQTRVAR